MGNSVKEKTKLVLMGKSGGKCEFRGCNERITEEAVTNTTGNYGNFAHIIADSPNGPRGDEILSKKLCDSQENIMVMCRVHHKLIDDNPEIYTVDVLNKMKKEHEDYIDKLLEVEKRAKVNVIKYSCKISDRSRILEENQISNSVVEQGYWINNTIDLSGNKYDESEEESFFKLEADNLKRLFNQQVKPLLTDEKNTNKCFLYAIAPQPLLVYLGSLFSEIVEVEVQQLQREPAEWVLSDFNDDIFEIKVTKPEVKNKEVALNISISGDIENKRIKEVLGDNVDIWKVESSIKSTDIIKSKKQIRQYREVIRDVYEEIKDKYGNKVEINVFPAMPISIAIETGRCWMKKAHPSLIIYDEKKGFKKSLEIKYNKEDF